MVVKLWSRELFQDPERVLGVFKYKTCSVPVKHCISGQYVPRLLERLFIVS